MAKKGALFSEDVIREGLQHFSITQVPDIETIRRLVTEWSNEIKSGRLARKKEESIRPKFLIDFFSKILGFSLTGEHSSMAIELKTFVDGKKADAGLGHFEYKHKGIDPVKVYAVIEIKDAATDLDDDSNGPSAISQAYEYAGKTEAKWVFVSNMKEIRFYQNGSLASYDEVLITDLGQEDTLARFLFLYHSTSVLDGIHKNIDFILSKSKIESVSASILVDNSSAHIIDQLDELVSIFEGLKVIDPYYLANQKPFNILDQDVDHFERWHLFTLNAKIYALLKEIVFNEGDFELSTKLVEECTKASVDRPKQKLERIFSRLTSGGIIWISAVANFREIENERTGPNKLGFVVTKIFSYDKASNQGITVRLPIKHHDCECVTCTFNSLEFTKLGKKLQKAPKTVDDSVEYAYGHYLLASDKFLSSYRLLKKSLQEEFSTNRPPVLQFIIHLNLRRLKGPLSWFAKDIDDEILKDVKTLDLERIIWDRFYDLKNEPRHKLLRSIKDEDFFERISNKVEEGLTEMQSIYDTYKGGSSYIAVPDYTNDLVFNFRLATSYSTANYLFYDRSYQLTNLLEKAFRGLVLSHASKAYPYKYASFDFIALRTAVIHIPSSNLEAALSLISNIEVTENDLRSFVELMQSYFGQNHQKTFLGDTEANDEMSSLLMNSYFVDTFRRVFGNLFVISQKISWNTVVWNASLTDNISKFLEVEDHLFWFDLKKFGVFLDTHTNLFSYNQLVTLLQICLDRHKAKINKYQHLIDSLCNCLKKAFPDAPIDSSRFYQQALASSYRNDKDLSFEILIHVYPIVAERHQHSIISEAEKVLTTNFDPYFYEKLLWKKMLDWKRGEFFDKLVQSVKAGRPGSSVTVKCDKTEMRDVTFYNFCLLVHFLEVPLNDQRLTSFSDLNAFEQWILNPLGFDYAHFDALWIVAVEKTQIIRLIKGKEEVIQCVEQKLKTDFHPKLAEIYYRWIQP